MFPFSFQLKIRENARLQSELAEVETNYRKRVSELESSLEQSQREAQKSKELLQIRDKSAIVSLSLFFI